MALKRKPGQVLLRSLAAEGKGAQGVRHTTPGTVSGRACEQASVSCSYFSNKGKSKSFFIQNSFMLEFVESVFSSLIAPWSSTPNAITGGPSEVHERFPPGGVKGVPANVDQPGTAPSRAQRPSWAHPWEDRPLGTKEVPIFPRVLQRK